MKRKERSKVWISIWSFSGILEEFEKKLFRCKDKNWGKRLNMFCTVVSEVLSLEVKSFTDEHNLQFIIM